jgi:hypothetical protein
MCAPLCAQEAAKQTATEGDAGPSTAPSPGITDQQLKDVFKVYEEAAKAGNSHERRGTEVIQDVEDGAKPTTWGVSDLVHVVFASILGALEDEWRERLTLSMIIVFASFTNDESLQPGISGHLNTVGVDGPHPHLIAETRDCVAKIAAAAAKDGADPKFRAADHLVKGVLCLVGMFTGKDTLLEIEAAPVYTNGGDQGLHAHGRARADDSLMQKKPNDFLQFLFRLSVSKYSSFQLKLGNLIFWFNQLCGTLSAHNAIGQGMVTVPPQPGAPVSLCRVDTLVRHSTMGPAVETVDGASNSARVRGASDISMTWMIKSLSRTNNADLSEPPSTQEFIDASKKVQALLGPLLALCAEHESLEDLREFSRKTNSNTHAANTRTHTHIHTPICAGKEVERVSVGGQRSSMSDKEKSSHEVGVVAREQTLLDALHAPDPALYHDIKGINSRELNMPSMVRAYQDVIALGRANPSKVSPQVLAKGVFEALEAAKAAIKNADAPTRQKGTWDCGAFSPTT